ncbi:alpha/beta hydrolase [Inhella sp.]|uniref:alpha/beta hydrolase n=1 Tax=Inhella sp. TaxID=1921806 RepID=UPI0035B01FFF
MQRRHLLLALPALATSSGCALKEIHLQEKNFLPDAPTPWISEQIQRRNVELTVEDGVLLRGWHLQHPQPRALLMYFLGNGDNVLAYSGQIHEIAHHFQVDVLVLDYRGSGASTGSKGLLNLRSDALRIHDALARPLADRRGGLRIVCWGYSMGSMPAIHLAAHRPVAGLAVLAGFSDFPDVRDSLVQKAPWYARGFVKFSWEPVFEQRPQPVDEIAQVRVPTFLFHGEADTLLPVNLGDRLNAAAGRATWKRYVRAPKVGHTRLPLFKGEAREGLDAWLAESLKG